MMKRARKQRQNYREKAEKRLALLEKHNKRLKASKERLEKENWILHEKIRLLKAKRFGRKADQVTDEQMGLFDGELECPGEEPQEDESKPVEAEETTQEAETAEKGDHKIRKRRRPGRRRLPKDLPREERIHDLPEEEKICACGAEMDEIGREIMEQLEVIPRQYKVVVHVRPKYACKCCQGVEGEAKGESTIKIAAPVDQLIPKSYASVSLLAQLLIGKYVDALPFYRQERQFLREGIELHRSTMCAWTRAVVQRAGPILERLMDACRAGPVLGIDETTLQVLKEPNRKATLKSYMWVMRGGPPENPVIVFDYDPSRSQAKAQALLADYRGVVQSDGYGVYGYLDKSQYVTHACCWAHVRRKFVDVIKALGGSQSASGAAQAMLNWIKELYRIEKRAKINGLRGEALLAERKKRSKPILETMKAWLDENVHKAPGSSVLGRAMAYTLKLWPSLIVFPDHAALTLDNNLVENAIRPFVLGRKNWQFSGNPEGAKASAAMFTLLETAKANGWNPQAYLTHLFDGLIHATTDQEYDELMPNRPPQAAKNEPSQP